MNKHLEIKPALQIGSQYGALRKILLSSMILAPVLIFVVALGIGYFYFITSLRSSTISQMKGILADHQQMIDSFLEERKGDLSLILDTYSYDELQDKMVLGRVLNQLQKKSNAFVDLGIFNTSGVHVNYQGPYDLTGRDYKGEAWFKAVMENGVYISDVFLGFRGFPHFIVAIVKHSRTQTWVIRATIDTAYFNRLVEKVSLGLTGEAYIVNAGGILQTRPRSGGELMTPGFIGLSKPEFHRGTEVMVFPDDNGQDFLMATTWLRSKLWMLVVRQETSDAFHTLHTAIYLIVLSTVVGILIIVMVSFYFTTRIIRRLEAMDVEKQKLKFQLIHASGLAELGEMATGFAHEINNPLQIIKSEQALIQMNLEDLTADHKLQDQQAICEITDSLDQIGLQIDRCAVITQSILKFGRRDKPTTECLDLRSFIPEIITMIRNRAELQNISINLDLKKLSLLVRADPSQLQQVFLNLFNNAIDAITEKYGLDGGRIDIAAVDVASRAIDVTIADNGIGISAENLKKVFTPFFTTKPAGKGTGLGLSVCYGIIKSLGGQMSAFSSEMGGTTFKVRLPTGNNVKEKRR